MTTQEIASRYYELANQAKWEQILDELAADSLVNQEPEHVTARGIQPVTIGKSAIKAKGANNRTQIEALHSQSCSEPTVAGEFFSLALRREVTMKGLGRIHREEIGLFQVKDGKIVLEQFFY